MVDAFSVVFIFTLLIYSLKQLAVVSLQRTPYFQSTPYSKRAMRIEKAYKAVAWGVLSYTLLAVLISRYSDVISEMILPF